MTNNKHVAINGNNLIKKLWYKLIKKNNLMVKKKKILYVDKTVKDLSSSNALNVLTKFVIHFIFIFFCSCLEK